MGEMGGSVILVEMSVRRVVRGSLPNFRPSSASRSMLPALKPPALSSFIKSLSHLTTSSSHHPLT